MEIGSLKQLREILLLNGIAISRWKRPKYKRSTDLWSELLQGETELDGPPLHRRISVVTIHIRRDNMILVEAEQLLSGGFTRKRSLPPSEKIKPGENYVEAAYRCFQEELGLSREQVRLLHSTHYVSRKVEDSRSYPGLVTKYTLHTIDAVVNGLDMNPFWTYETHNPNDPVIGHRWIWVCM